MSRENVEIVRRVLDAANRRDTMGTLISTKELEYRFIPTVFVILRARRSRSRFQPRLALGEIQKGSRRRQSSANPRRRRAGAGPTPRCPRDPAGDRREGAGEVRASGVSLAGAVRA